MIDSTALAVGQLILSSGAAQINLFAASDEEGMDTARRLRSCGFEISDHLDVQEIKSRLAPRPVTVRFMRTLRTWRRDGSVWITIHFPDRELKEPLYPETEPLPEAL
jgi:hypothetical protein